MTMRFLMFGVVAFLQTSLYAQVLHPKDSWCFNGGDSKSVVYLHSLDDPKATASHFHRNLKLLEDVAKKKSLRIFVPRSQHQCKGSLCWPQHSHDVMIKTWEEIREASKKCLNTQNKSIDKVLGFSNGGFYVSKLALRCLIADGPKAWISVGSHLGAEEINKSCQEFSLAVGKRDRILATAQESLKHFGKEKTPKLIIYEGGHELTAAFLEEVL